MPTIGEMDQALKDAGKLAHILRHCDRGKDGEECIVGVLRGKCRRCELVVNAGTECLGAPRRT